MSALIALATPHPLSPDVERGEGLIYEAAMFPNSMKTLSDFQAFHRWLDEQKGFDDDVFETLILLMGELGEVAQVAKKIRWRAQLLRRDPDQPPARLSPVAAATNEYRATLGQELADCLAYLIKLANAADIDLHQAYIAKMERNIRREWIDPNDASVH